MAGTTLAQGSSVTLTVVATDSVLIDSAAGAQARIEAVSGVAGAANKQMLAFHPGGQRTYGPFGAGDVKLTAVTGAIQYTKGTAPLGDEGGFVKTYLDTSGQVAGIQDQNGAVLALSEATAYVNLTATGTAFTGACEYAGYVCTVAAGNITVYDNTSAAGTVIVPTTALAVGAFPIFGAGTNGKMALTTGCHVVLSGAATVNVLVG